MQTKTNLKIDWATHEAAKYACENWHYSKTMPVNKTVKVGAWEDGAFVGVVIFSPGASPDLYKSYSITQQEGCELTRIALRQHKSPVSRILSVAFKFLKKSNPKLRLVISFADTNQGHHGGVYQATNWIYNGTSAARKVPIVNGKQIHERSLSVMVKQGKIKRSNCEWVVVPPKHRYLMPLDDDMRKRILPLSKPYPKRASSKDSVASGYQSEEGGAIPTDALQLSEVVNG
jgi:hypothetical protein